jgi:hypothetical protein
MIKGAVEIGRDVYQIGSGLTVGGLAASLVINLRVPHFSRSVRKVGTTNPEDKQAGWPTPSNSLIESPKLRLPHPLRFSKGGEPQTRTPCSQVTDRIPNRLIYASAQKTSPLLRYRTPAFHYLKLLPASSSTRHTRAAESLLEGSRTGAASLRLHRGRIRDKRKTKLCDLRL